MRKFLLGKRLVVALSSLILALGVKAQQLEPMYNDCVSINQNMAHVKARMDQDRFRMPVPDAEPAVFNWQSLPSFQEYLTYARALIEQRNPKAFNACPVVTETATLIAKGRENTTVADLVMPFELKQPSGPNQRQKGILLIHGLTDSPFLYHDLAYFYFKQGFNVRTLLLPGHGTAAGDLLNVHRDDWRQAAAYGIKRMEKDFEQVYLGGYSTGAALFFDYLATNKASPQIKALFSWAPASKVNSGMAWLAKYIDYIPFFDWLGKEADIDFAKYESFPINAAGQVDSLMTEMTEKVTTNKDTLANIPTFTLYSQDDQTIDAEATTALLNVWHNPSKRPMTQADTVVFYGNLEKAEVPIASGIRVINPTCSRADCQKIKGISHTGATSSPHNPHYGANGNYRSCSHYTGDEAKYVECKTGDANVVGALSSKNIETFESFQRLTYNPYFDEMTAAIVEFLKQINTH